jgi:hypothetical protein
MTLDDQIRDFRAALAKRTDDELKALADGYRRNVLPHRSDSAVSAEYGAILAELARRN